MYAIVFIAGSRIFCDRKRLFTGENITLFYKNYNFLLQKTFIFIFFEDASIKNFRAGRVQSPFAHKFNLISKKSELFFLLGLLFFPKDVKFNSKDTRV